LKRRYASEFLTASSAFCHDRPTHICAHVFLSYVHLHN